MKFTTIAITAAVLATMLVVANAQTSAPSVATTTDDAAAHRGGRHGGRGGGHDDDHYGGGRGGRGDMEWREVPGPLPPMFPQPGSDNEDRHHRDSHSGSWSGSHSGEHETPDHRIPDHNGDDDNKHHDERHPGHDLPASGDDKARIHEKREDDHDDDEHGRRISGMLMLVGSVCVIIGVIATLIYCIRTKCCKKQVQESPVEKIVVGTEFHEEHDDAVAEKAAAAVDGVVIGDGADSHHPMKPAPEKEQPPVIVAAALY